MRERILAILDEIEKKEKVRIVHAVESGSRAWGFASPDSDYDVRFVYLRPEEHYLLLQEKKDFIECGIDDLLDVSGWDLSKALQHFQRSNAVLFEWSGSPIVYRTTEAWKRVRELSKRYFSCKAAMYHYYAMARKNERLHLREEEVKYKKYLYVLRPILACLWIQEKRTPPPVLFDQLAAEMLDDEMKPVIDRFLERKKLMAESERAPRIPEIDDYIRRRSEECEIYCRQIEDGRNPDWEPLNQLFLSLLKKEKADL